MPRLKIVYSLRVNISKPVADPDLSLALFLVLVAVDLRAATDPAERDQHLQL